MINRQLIDRIFEELSNRDLVDRWNYAVQVSRNFIEYLKSGERLSRDKCFIKSSKFNRIYSISPEEIFSLLFPIFEEFQEGTIDNLINDFDNFLRDLKYQIQTNHYEVIYSKGSPKENYGRHLVSIAVFGFFRKEGFVYHEVKSGRGLIDILVCSDREIIIETKLDYNFDPKSKQLQKYVEAREKRKGYYIIFDCSETFDMKKYCDIENNQFPQSNGYSVIVCHVNPSVPSSS